MASWLSNTGNGYQIRVTVTTKSQNVSKNQSTLNWKIEIINPSNHWFNAKATGNVKVAGKTVWTISSSTINSGGSAGTTKTLASGTVVVNHNSSGNASAAVSAAFKTVNQSAGWRVPQLTISGKTFKPKRIDQLPNKPGSAPTVSQNQSTRVITARSATAGANGGKITGYQIRRRNQSGGSYGGWTTATADNNRRITFTAAHFYTNYQFQSRARTARGWGPWSATKTFRSMASGPSVRSGGNWKNTIAYVKVDGEWKICIVYVKHNGVWKIAGG